MLPFILLAVVIFHIVFLHEVGSTNPSPLIENVSTRSYIYFYPYYYIKDFFSLIIFLFLYLFLVCYYPNLLGHSDNYIQANALVTPEHIVPEWYFLPFYAILRSVESKSLGVILMALSLLIFFVIPFFSK
jgi:quinol-cytochrome oxidoreductase complex cytochrome b subunit